MLLDLRLHFGERRLFSAAMTSPKGRGRGPQETDSGRGEDRADSAPPLPEEVKSAGVYGHYGNREPTSALSTCRLPREVHRGNQTSASRKLVRWSPRLGTAARRPHPEGTRKCTARGLASYSGRLRAPLPKWCLW